MKSISEILQKIGVKEKELKGQINESKWGIICLGAIGYAGNETTAKFLTDLILNNKNDEFKLHAASALGNIASRHDDKLIP